MATNTYSGTLIDNLWDASATPRNQVMRATALVALGVILLTLSAKIQVPFFPVPLTFQTLVVLLIGLAYGSKLGFATVLSYLSIGAMGLPVFAGTPEKGLGLAYMMGPTGGYLAGFLVAAWAMGQLAVHKYDRSYGRMLLSMALGLTIIYACGLFYLGALLGWDKPILAWGLMPFIPGEVLKVVLATLLMPTIWKWVKSRNAE